MIDAREYRDLARESGGYTDIELDILGEALTSWSEAPDKPFILVELRDGKVLAGFAVLRREEVTEYTFNVQALCVGPSYRGTGVIGKLLDEIEGEIETRAASAILRIEISASKVAALDSNAISKAGYSLIGHIPDFYARGNDYYMYAKHIHRAIEAEGGDSGE